MNTKTILVLGGTGNTGSKLVKMALERGHKVKAMVRDSAPLYEHPDLTVVYGEVLDSKAVRAAVDGVDAVVSCLGIRKADPSDPFSDLLSPEDFTEKSTSNIVGAMKQGGINRLVVISSAGIGDSWEFVAPNMQSVISGSTIGIIFRDLNNMENVLKTSGLDTLAVRPVVLVDGELSDGVELVSHFDPTTRISNADVAKWMLDAVERREPFVSSTEMIWSKSLSKVV